MDMPGETAFQLKTLALNSDPRFNEQGIVSLRLNGDQLYVNIATGLLTAAATIGFLAALWMKIPATFSSIIGLAYGRILTLLAVLLVIAGIGFSYPKTSFSSCRNFISRHGRKYRILHTQACLHIDGDFSPDIHRYADPYCDRNINPYA